MAAIMAGGVLTASGLWMPGEKVISIPSKRFFVPEGSLAWLDDGKPMVMMGRGKIFEIPQYFDIDIRGFQIHREVDGEAARRIRA